jgi:hypothetical protein
MIPTRHPASSATSAAHVRPRRVQTSGRDGDERDIREPRLSSRFPHNQAAFCGHGAKRIRTADLLGAMESRAPTCIWPEPPGGRLVAGVSGLGGHLDESSCRVNFGPFGRRLDAAPRTTPGTASDRCQDTSLGSMTSSVVGRVDRCRRRRAHLRGVVRARRRIGRPQREPPIAAEVGGRGSRIRGESSPVLKTGSGRQGHSWVRIPPPSLG